MKVLREQEIHGACFGVKLIERSDENGHILVSLMIGDDEHWYEKDFVMSSAWLDDMINTLEQTKVLLEKGALPSEFNGYVFKD